jgi:prefoldin subunit 5
MRDQLEKRRDELAQELKAGQEMLADLDNRRSELQQTMLRITGALQVLEELLAAAADDEPAEASPAMSLVAD